VQATGASLEDRLRELEDNLAKKHEKLWQDVHRAVEEVRHDHKTSLAEDVVQRRDEMRTHSKSHVNYVTQLLASAHKERKIAASCKGFFEVWREQAWAEKSSRTGLRWLATALGRMAENRERRAMERWRHTTAVESMTARLGDAYQAKIPDVHKIVEESASGLRSRCDELSSHIETVNGHLETINGNLSEKCSQVSFSEAVEAHSSQLQAQMVELEQVKTNMGAWIEEHKEALAQTDEKHDHHREALAGHRRELEGVINEHIEKWSDVNDRIGACAVTEDLQAMMKDVLLIWNSLKQLDAAKADKTTMDAFAVELTASFQRSARSSEEIQAVGSRARADASRSCEELQVKLDGTTNHWQAMWDKLAGLMEETIGKVADLQGTKQQRRSSVSASGRDESPTRGREAPASRPSSLPPTPGSSQRSSAPTLQRGGLASSSAASTASSTVAGSPLVALVLSGSRSSLTGGPDLEEDRHLPGPSFPRSEVKVGRLRPSSAGSRRPPTGGR